MPGTMAGAYRAMGGEVALYGKPVYPTLLRAPPASTTRDGRSWSATAAPYVPGAAARGAALRLRRRDRRPCATRPT